MRTPFLGAARPSVKGATGNVRECCSLEGNAPHERRVALVPEITAGACETGRKLHMQTGRGDASSFPDESYKDVVFMEDRAKLVAAADVVWRCSRPALDVIDAMQRVPF
jgi:NAD/NADP transhydrogenase alpha subunit